MVDKRYHGRYLVQFSRLSYTWHVVLFVSSFAIIYLDLLVLIVVLCLLSFVPLSYQVFVVCWVPGVDVFVMLS